MFCGKRKAWDARLEQNVFFCYSKKMYVLTEREKAVLEFLKEKGRPVHETEIAAALKTVSAALDGCRAKRFVEKDERGFFHLTQSGRNAF